MYESTGYDPNRPMRSTASTESLRGILTTLGYVSVILGVLAALWYLQRATRPGMFSKGNIAGTDVVISLVILFLGCLWGVVPIGLAKCLERLHAVGVAAGASAANAGGEGATSGCPGCGKPVQASRESPFCVHCGERVVRPAPAACPKCNQPVPSQSTSRFCESCGASLFGE